MTVGGQLTPPSLPIDSLNRISKAMRLKTQLGVNLAGISIIFDLLDEIERLKKSKNLKKKY